MSDEKPKTRSDELIAMADALDVIPDQKPAEASAPAVHGDELWGGPRFIENAQREPVWVETKEQYWELLNRNQKRMVDQQESDPGPHFGPPPEPLPIELTPPPPLKPMLMEEAHVWAAMSAVYHRYGLREALWCKQCAMRHLKHGCAVSISHRRVRLECRCGVAEYEAPRGTTDLLHTIANTAITSLDRTAARVETPFGDRMVPAHLLQDREAQLIRRYAKYLVDRNLEPWIVCRYCSSTSTYLREDDNCGINITSEQIAIVCPKFCRMLFYQGRTRDPYAGRVQ